MEHLEEEDRVRASLKNSCTREADGLVLHIGISEGRQAELSSEEPDTMVRVVIPDVQLVCTPRDMPVLFSAAPWLPEEGKYARATMYTCLNAILDAFMVKEESVYSVYFTKDARPGRPRK